MVGASSAGRKWSPTVQPGHEGSSDPRIPSDCRAISEPHQCPDGESFDEEPVELLDLQEGTQPYRILQFLARNDDKAFTQSKIHDATGIKRGSVGAVLSGLEERGLVRHRGRYWAVSEDNRLASYAAQTGASSASTTDDYYGGE